MFEEKQQSGESGDNGVSGDAKGETENRMMNDSFDGNGRVDTQIVEGAAEENAKTSESKELLKGEGVEG